MSYSQRVTNQVGTQAESEKTFTDFVYNDTSADLTIGMPVYFDVTDAAEFNTLYPATAVTGSGAQTRSGKRVVLGVNANAGALAGIFQPDSYGSAPSKGDVIKCLVDGPGIVHASQVATTGTQITVGASLIGNTANNFAVVGTAALNETVGIALATGATVSNAAVIHTAYAGGDWLINANVKIR